MGSDMKDDGGERIAFREGAGTKEADVGRGHYELVSPLFMRRLAVWLEKGAEKYDARNWEDGLPMGRIMRALLRHTYQYLEGMRDEDHLAAISCNIMFLIHFEVGIERGLYSAEDAKEMQNLPDYIKELKEALDIWCKIEGCKEMKADDDTSFCEKHAKRHRAFPCCIAEGCINAADHGDHCIDHAFLSRQVQIADARKRYSAARIELDALEKEDAKLSKPTKPSTICQFRRCDVIVGKEKDWCPMHFPQITL